MKRKTIFLLLSILIVVSFGCNEKLPITLDKQCVQYQFEFLVLPLDSLPLMNKNFKGLESPDKFRDGAGVEMTKYKTAYFYNPVHLSQRALSYLDAYYQTDDTTYMNRGKDYLRQLQNMSHTIEDASFYPYLVDYEVHQNKFWTLNAPWYSGMAQGLALSAQVRAFELYGDSTFIEEAKRTLRSFEPLQGESENWFCRYDSLGCFWIEEYPLDSAGMTLNGFIYSIYGLYDFWRINQDEQCEKLLNESVSTIKNYISLYQCPSEDSYYCLQHSHHHGTNLYHLIHIEQLRFLYNITGDLYFKEMADKFYEDSH